MDTARYTLDALMEQLGLPGDEASTNAFIVRHGSIPTGTLLAEAPFWTASQASFLREAIEQDGPWALPVDELDARFRDD